MPGRLRVEEEVEEEVVVVVQRMIRLHRRSQIALTLQRGVVLTQAFDST